MPRYVILQHNLPAHSGRESHYDLMLEQDGKLLTWAIAELPRPGLQTTATKLPDHRLAYLDYEGPVSDDRGEVLRVGAGESIARELGQTYVLCELRSASTRLMVELRHTSDDRWTAQFRAAE